jgi:hypothetical protein
MSDFIIKRKLDYVYNKKIESFELPKKDKLLVGDSHSISVWPGEDYNIQRMDGKTLYGFLKSPVASDYMYFGNIDVRFHLCRQPDPVSAAINLVKRYIEFAKSCNAKVSCLLPIESESRKLPGTGLYKGKKYYGTMQERSKLVHIFNNELLSSGLQVNEWPERWYKDLDFYEKEVMEPRQSVHIRPKFYAKENNTTLNLKDKLTLGI